MTVRNTVRVAVWWCLLGSVVPAAAQSVRYIDDDAPVGGNGLAWETAYKYLQDALFEASGDPGITEIHVGGGVYQPDQDEAGQVTPGDREATFHLLNGLAIMGGYRGCPDGDCSGGDPNERDIEVYETLFSGDLLGDDGPEPFDNNDENSYHVVTASSTDGTAVLDGLTITAGNANGPPPHTTGGGMYNSYSSPTVAACTFSGNSGCGMYNGHSSPTVTACTFRGNVGGGMYNLVDSSPTVANCTFRGNSAYSGGGMRNAWDSMPTVTNCTFSGNTGYGNGGGMYNDDSEPTVTNCSFVGNSTNGYGGGMLNDHSHPTVINCTFSGNSAQYAGGMGNQDSSDPTVVGCTFSGNSAYYYGGGMYNFSHLYSGGSDPAVTNCTFSGNSAGWEGGGMCNHKCSPPVTGSTFSGNSVVWQGGGMCNWSASPAVTDCVFTGNTADEGGGIWNYAGSPALTNCSFTGNSAQDGGGMWNDASSNLTAGNCIMWSDVPQEISGVGAVMYSDIQGGWPGEGDIDADPLFVDADGPDGVPGTEDDNLRLSASSPCIDAGSNLRVPLDWTDVDGDGDTTERTPLDRWGIPRFIDDLDTDDTGLADPPDYPAVVDMGAYEYHVPGDLDFDGDIDGDDYWIFAAALPSCVGDSRYNPAADLDFDGCVTLVDYQIWLVLYGEANPPPPAPPPAPAKPGKQDDPAGTGTHGQPGRAAGR